MYKKFLLGSVIVLALTTVAVSSAILLQVAELSGFLHTHGHTIPSLDTLAKIAGAMETPLSNFFAESGHTNGTKGLPQLSDDEVRFLSQIRRYAVSLNDSDRKLVLAMVKKMAANAAR